MAALGLMVLSFQNCQKAALSSGSNDNLSKADGVLTPVTANDPEDAQGTILQPDAPTSDTPTTDTPPTDMGPYTSVDSGDGNVCILDGPGKSVKLGMTSAGVPKGQNKIPQVLCMSANACLKIASQYFVVKGPEFRGYCKLPHGNPHVTHISDADLQLKINDLLKK